MMLRVESHARPAVDVGTAHLASPAAPVMPDDSIRNTADPVASIRKTPSKVDVGAVGEPFVEAFDSIKHLAGEGKVDGGTLPQVAGTASLPCPAVVQATASRRRERQARRDVLVSKQRGQAGCEPSLLRPTSCVCEH